MRRNLQFGRLRVHWVGKDTEINIRIKGKDIWMCSAVGSAHKRFLMASDTSIKLSEPIESTGRTQINVNNSIHQQPADK